MIINVEKIIASNLALSEEKGEKLYNEIIKELEELKDNEQIILDFKDIKKTITTFFNTSYGKLFSDYSDEIINKRINFINIQDITKFQIKIVKDNAIKFYSKPKNEEIYN